MRIYDYIFYSKYKNTLSNRTKSHAGFLLFLIFLFANTFLYSQAPANDNCSGATYLNCGTSGLAGSTVGAVLETAPGPVSSASGMGVWYTFVGDGTPTVISSTGTGGFDQEMTIVSGACGSFTNITSLDAFSGNGTETYSFTSTIGVNYYVYISYWSSSDISTTGTFTVSLSCTGAPCSGTPNGGTAAISTATGCTGSNFTLSASGITNGSGMSYQWQTAPSASGPWTNISGATTTSSSTSVSSIGTTYYQLVSTCSNSGQTATSTVVSYTATACVLMPTSGVSYVTTCGTTIYDSGGSGGDYSNNENGTIIIRPTSMTDVLTVTGTCTLRNNDVLNIDEGEDSNTGTYINTYTTNTANQAVSYTASGPGIPLAIQFYSNGSNVNPGFALTISCACAKPTAITLTATNSTTCNVGGSVTVNSVTAPNQKPWVMTTFQNDALPALSWLPTAPATNAWISGNASMLNANTNCVQLTPNSGSQNGALVFESYGSDQDEFLGAFDIYAGGTSSADGLAFSFGPSIATTNPTASTGAYETGVGDGLRIAFDSYNNGSGIFPTASTGTNVQNIYLIYNNTVLTSYTTSNTTFWRSAQNLCQVYISPAGNLYLDVGTTSVFSGYALPAAYLNADKSTWRAAFTARTGGAYDQHYVDNINLYHFYDYEYSIDGSTWQSSSTFTGLASGNYNMYVRLKGITSCSYSQAFTISAPVSSTAPTSVSGTSAICNGSSTTLTTTGGTSGTDAEDYWYEGACPTECYTQEFLTQPFTSNATTQNSLTNGVLNVTSTSGDAGINMPDIGPFNPSSCRYVSIRYKVTGGTGGLVEIYYSKVANNADLSESQVVRGNLVSDGQWNIINLDMSTSANWTGSITGWRFDWCTNSGVTMDIDFITLSNTPIYAQGTSITVSPTTATTYYTLKKGACNTTTCVSSTVSVANVPTTATVGSAQTICGLTSNALGGNTPTTGTGSWSIVSGGTGSFADATAGNTTFTGSTSGVYVLRWTIANSPCTASTADVTVTLYQSPTTASVGSTQNVCGSLVSGALGGNTPTVGTGAWTIVSGGTGTFSDATSGSSTFTANATGNFVLQWTITNGTCTASTATINVNFFSSATASISGSTTYCAGSSVTLTASGGTSYAWSNGTLTDINTVSPSGNVSYTVTVTDANGCTGTASTSLTSNPLPSAPMLSNNGPVCSGGSGTFTITGTAGLVVSYTGVTGSPVSPVTIGAGGTVQVNVSNVTSAQTLTISSVSNGTCSLSPVALSSSISSTTCATINECDVLVYRIESGSATTTTTVPISIVELAPGFTNTSSPTIISNPVTGTNNLTMEAGLTASTQHMGYMGMNNGILGVPGFNVASGTTTIISTDYTNDESVNLISANQAVTTRTTGQTFTGSPSYIGAVAPVDATRYYYLGLGTTQTTSGIFYYNGTTSVQIFSDANYSTKRFLNIRIFNGQLYASRVATNTSTGYIFAIGNGLPTSSVAAANVVSIATAPNGSSLPKDFSISPDGSTMYVIDPAAFTSTGISKWTKSTNGSSFSRVGSYQATGNSVSTSAKYPLSITVDWLSTPVKMFATVSTSAMTSATSTASGLYLNSYTESGGIGSSTTTWPAAASVPYYTSTNGSCTSCKFAGVTLAPSITASMSASTGCVGNPVTVTASSLQGLTLTYQWYKFTGNANYVDYYGATTVTGADGSGGTTSVFTPSATGNYFCEISGGSCAKYRTPPVVISNTYPSIDNVSQGVCTGSTADVTVTASGATAPYDVAWSGTASGNPAGTEIAASGGSYAITALASGSYTITVTAASGCSATASTTVTCSSCSNPVITTEPTGFSECINATQSLSVVATGTTLTYQWYSNTSNSNSGGTLIGTATNASYTPPSTSAGTTYYYCIISSGACTVTSAVAAVIVNANPSTPTIGTITQPTCTVATGSVDLSGLPASGTWTVTGSPSGSLTSTGTTGTVTGLTAGTTYTFTVTDANGCTSTASANAVVNAIPSNPSISGTTTTCINSTTQLSGTGTPAGSNPWTSSDNLIATVSNTGLVTGVQSGSVNITYTDNNGCFATTNVTIDDIIDWVNLQWPPNGSMCQNGTFNIYGQLYNTGASNTIGAGVAASGVTVEFGYSTSNSNPNTWTNWSTATFNPSGGGTNNDEYSGTFSGLAVGTYYYTFRYQINGCGWQYGGYSAGGGDIWDGTSYVSGVLTVNPNPSPTITAGTLCAGSNTTLSTSGGGTYLWSPNGETTSFITITSGGTYSVTVTNNGCSGSASTTVNVSNPPSINAISPP